MDIRLLTARPGAATLARFDGGDARIGRGHARPGPRARVGHHAGPAWNDLALKPVYLPFVHQLVRQVAGYREQPGWVTVGQAI